jgi:NTE family protein
MPSRKSMPPEPAPALPSPVPGPSMPLALALGGGGARGLAHIPMLEALDDLGLKPSVIVGTSMGAIVGAAYAAGMSGKDLRKATLEKLKDRTQVMAKLLQARVGRIADLFSRGFGNPVLVDGETLLDLFWPDTVPDLFEDLAIPFSAVATDYHARCEAVFATGPLVTGVAASMAIPGLVRPVAARGRVFVDGGAVNPLPFDLLPAEGHLVVAVDVTGGLVDGEGTPPEPFEAMLGSAQIMQDAIVAEKLKARTPDVLVRPGVAAFRVLDFFQAKLIVQKADAARDPFKRDIEAAIARRDGRSAGSR